MDLSGDNPLFRQQIIRPKRDLSESEALTEAERIFNEKVQEKLYQKGYDEISFEVAPHFVPSFSKWRMSDEPEEIVASIHETRTHPVDSLQNILHDLSERFLQNPCPQCETCHRRYLVDLGDGKTYTPETVISLLSQDQSGNRMAVGSLSLQRTGTSACRDAGAIGHHC